MTSVSIALTTCNGAGFLEEQLDSYLRQTRHPDELVVCDDASDDSTMAILERFSIRAPFPVLVLRNTTRLRVATSLERAARSCHGDIVFVSDQDDVWLDSKIQSHCLAFAQDPSAVMVCSNSEMVGSDLTPMGTTLFRHARFSRSLLHSVRKGKAFAAFIRHPALAGHGMSFRRQCTELFFPVPDTWLYDSWIPLLSAAYGNVVMLEKPLMLYRKHAAQSMGAGSETLVQKAIRGDRQLSRRAFDREIENLAVLIARMERVLPKSALRTTAAGLISDKSRFLSERRQMREVSTGSRLWLIGRCVARRQYWRVGRGWLGVARDVIAP